MTSDPAAISGADASAPLDDTPLSPEDFDALEDALERMREADEDTPQWEFCEGFMAALICTRRPVPDREYWPVLLGGAFNAGRYMAFAWHWKRRWREIETALDAPVDSLQDERCYVPEMGDVRGFIAGLPEDERAEVAGLPAPAFGQLWALGFLFAVEQWADEWAAPRDREATRMLRQALSEIEALAEDDSAPPTVPMSGDDSPASASEQRVDTYARAVWAVYDLRQLWQSYGPRVAALRKAPAPGRNDPCPCGSGKKYKHCCGR